MPSVPLWLTDFFRPLPLGKRGERAAARYLRRRGYAVVAGGHRGRYGEIDLIAVWRREVVVFVEVKTRRDRHAGGPEAAVDGAKQQRIVRTALEYLKANDLLEHPARFDVVAIVWPEGRWRPDAIEHFEGAFEPAERGQFYS